MWPEGGRWGAHERPAPEACTRGEQSRSTVFSQPDPTNTHACKSRLQKAGVTMGQCTPMRGIHAPGVHQHDGAVKRYAHHPAARHAQHQPQQLVDTLPTFTGAPAHMV